MTRRSRVFLCWALVLSALWVFLNLPQDGGSLKRFLQWAGFPLTFAVWESGRLAWFDPVALAADIVLGVGVVVVVAAACAHSRCRERVVAEPTAHRKAEDNRRGQAGKERT